MKKPLALDSLWKGRIVFRDEAEEEHCDEVVKCVGGLNRDEFYEDIRKTLCKVFVAKERGQKAMGPKKKYAKMRTKCLNIVTEEIVKRDVYFYGT